MFKTWRLFSSMSRCFEIIASILLFFGIVSSVTVGIGALAIICCMMVVSVDFQTSFRFRHSHIRP